MIGRLLPKQAEQLPVTLLVTHATLLPSRSGIDVQLIQAVAVFLNVATEHKLNVIFF